jgi:hypothetical protein
MLADRVDYVVGVDPHRDSHALAIVHVLSGAVVFEATIAASGQGYAEALQLVDAHAAGRRAFAVEGSGSFGAGLTRFLTSRGERVLEVSRLRRERRSGGKPTRSMRFAPPGACSARSGPRPLGLAVNVRPCRRWWRHGKEPSARSAPDSLRYAIC